MNPPLSSRPALVLLLSLGLGLGLAACSSTDDPAATPAAATCGQPAPPGAGPTVAILGQTGDGLDYYADDARLIIDGATAMGARVLVSGVGDPAQPATTPSLLAQTAMVGEGPNTLMRDKDLQCKVDLINEGLADLRSAPAATVHDVFGAIVTLADTLGPETAEVDVVLLAPAASNASPDLTDPAVAADPTGVLNQLAEAGRIPQCASWSLHLVGPEVADNPALREFWRAYARRCGGKLVDWTTHLTQFPGPRTEIAEADTALIEVTTTQETIEADLSGDVLFDSRQAVLRPEAEASLVELLQLATGSEGRVDIVGHTDTRGRSDDNKVLSERRAQAVGGWFVSHGIDPARVHVSGMGEADPRIADASDDAEHQQNRRVTVSIQR